jgi:hypothetical protein
VSDQPRSVEDIEAEIQRTRLAMQSTVNELSGRLNPRTQAKAAAEKAGDGAIKFGQNIVEDAKAVAKGDPRSLAKFASVATLVGLVAGVAKLRK